MAAGACLEDDVVEALLVELWCVAADGAHDRVEVEVARRDQLALELGPDRHRRELFGTPLSIRCLSVKVRKLSTCFGAQQKHSW